MSAWLVLSGRDGAGCLGGSDVLREPEAEELPAVARVEEAAVRRTDVVGPRRARAAPDHHLIAHKLAVVLAERAGEGLEAGVGGVRRAGPFPDVAVELADGSVGGVILAGCRVQEARVEQVAGNGLLCGRELPLRFRRQPCAGPACESVRLVVADVTDGRVRIDRTPSAERELLLEILGPAEWAIPAFLADHGPAVREPEGRIRIAALRDEVPVLAVRDE